MLIPGLANFAFCVFFFWSKFYLTFCTPFYVASMDLILGKHFLPCLHLFLTNFAFYFFKKLTSTRWLSFFIKKTLWQFLIPPYFSLILFPYYNKHGPFFKLNFRPIFLIFMYSPHFPNCFMFNSTIFLSSSYSIFRFMTINFPAFSHPFLCQLYFV